MGLAQGDVGVASHKPKDAPKHVAIREGGGAAGGGGALQTAELDDSRSVSFTRGFTAYL